mmetsp:Transcript_22169/g.65343  ORF Transcript_22169/g.65343 Transcript_22169/m.65343 type:complete len:272 (+) Transcript_22169:469-1284(+)
MATSRCVPLAPARHSGAAETPVPPRSSASSCALGAGKIGSVSTAVLASATCAATFSTVVAVSRRTSSFCPREKPEPRRVTASPPDAATRLGSAPSTAGRGSTGRNAAPTPLATASGLSAPSQSACSFTQPGSATRQAGSSATTTPSSPEGAVEMTCTSWHAVESELAAVQAAGTGSFLPSTGRRVARSGVDTSRAARTCTRAGSPVAESTVGSTACTCADSCPLPAEGRTSAAETTTRAACAHACRLASRPILQGRVARAGGRPAFLEDGA